MKTLETVKKDITKIIRKYFVVQSKSPEAYQLSNLEEDNLVVDLVSYIFLKVIKK